jgi:hypothetical protein
MKNNSSLGNIEDQQKPDPILLRQLAKVMEILQDIED